MSFEIECVTEFAAGPAPDEWDRVLAGSAADALFLSRPFQEAWWCTFCCNPSASCQLALLLLREGGTLVGVAPFYLSTVDEAGWAEETSRAADWRRIVARTAAQDNPEAARPEGRTAAGESAATAAAPPEAAPRPGERVVRLVGGVAVADYLNIIAPAGRECEAWAAVLAYWAGRAADWDVLDLHSLPAASATSARCAASAHGAVWCGVEETCPVLALPAAWDDYLAALGKKDRHELRRKLRRAESHPEPLTWRTVNKGPELAAALETFIALHRRSDEAKARFMTPIMVTFFHRLLAAFAPTGWLEVATLYAGDHPVAAYLSFRQAARLLLYNSGYDPRYGGYSAGFALLVYRIRQAIEEGVQTFDFLRGDERYKYDLGAQDQFIYRVIIRK
jgi:CelD/BcsL family acetyltransferase involved in cellulose biosynthesis